MVSVVEDIVTHFTLQVDTTKAQKCAFLEGLVKRLVEKSIDFCFKLFFTAIVPELTPVMNYYVTDALQNKYEGWQNKYKAWLESELQAVSPGPMIQLKINLPIIQKEKKMQRNPMGDSHHSRNFSKIQKIQYLHHPRMHGLIGMVKYQNI